MSLLFKNNTISVLNEVTSQFNDTDKLFENGSQIIISPEYFKTGWYFVEIELISNQTFTGAMFIIETGGNSEELYIPLKGGNITKRLIWIQTRPEKIYFTMGEPIVDLKLAKFKFDISIFFN